jgi:geranylgeranyl pyrophosphate synthase
MNDDLRACLQAIPEFQAWPEMAAIFDRSGARPRPDWELPLVAGQAVGGDPARLIYGAAAMACLQISIILADDILDDDPRGEHLKIGAGRAANLALGFQGAAAEVIARAPVEPACQAAAQQCLAHAALKTALGQHLDVLGLDGEAGYWRVVEHKSTPFYAAALQLGAILGGAAADVCAGVYTVGKLLGEIIQLNDDVVDAFQSPANPDWGQGRPNLLILYARSAPHGDRGRFLTLQAQAAQDPAALAEAQRLLIQSGAVSYAIYQLVQRTKQAHGRLGELPLVKPEALAERINPLSPALVKLLSEHGVPIDGLLVKS